MKLRLTLSLPVSINELYVNQYQWNAKLKMKIPTGAKVLSSEGERVKKAIQNEAIYQMALQKEDWDYEWTKSNFIYLDTAIYFNRRGRDDNNIYKLLCDSLEKICYDNDSRVLVRTQKILYDYDKPRLEAYLHPVSYKGIFSNQERVEAFESHCMGCSRYSRNCSILKNAKQGVIQKEIHNFICSEYKEKAVKKSKKKG